VDSNVRTKMPLLAVVQSGHILAAAVAVDPFWSAVQASVRRARLTKAAAPAEQNRPAGHGRHMVMPAFEYVALGQGVHEVARLWSENRPAVHAAQMDAPTSEYRPDTHPVRNGLVAPAAQE
jgi:hypothetical protein